MIQLKIEWDGAVPGIAERRLSVQYFGMPFRNLLMGIRRTANNMLRQGIDRKDADFGRLATEADNIDIQIAELTSGSLVTGSVIDVKMPTMGQQMPLMAEHLAGDALDRFLEDMEKESRGVKRNKSARRFLHSLPPGLTSQVYRLYIDGQERRTVTIGALNMPIEINALPFLMEVEGYVIGVGFDPGKHFIRVKASDSTGSETTFQATAQQVNMALEYRENEVRVLALANISGKRVLRVQQRQDGHIRLDTQEYIFSKWNDALAELAR